MSVFLLFTFKNTCLEFDHLFDELKSHILEAEESFQEFVLDIEHAGETLNEQDQNSILYSSRKQHLKEFHESL